MTERPQGHTPSQILLEIPSNLEREKQRILQESISPTLDQVVLPNPSDLVFQIESCDTFSGDVLVEDRGLSRGGFLSSCLVSNSYLL